jgi:hypothetical protein
MDDNEAVEMMQRASSEIKMLRRQINILSPKADAYDVLAKTINAMTPRQSGVMSEDVEWLLDKRIDEMKKAKANPVPTEMEL